MPAVPNVEYVANALRTQYGDFSHHNKANPLSELLFILCSAKTDESKYIASYRELRRRFPSFQQLADATVSDIAAAIAGGGLAQRKAKAIKSITQILVKRFGKPTLSPIKRMSDHECEKMLTALPFIGKKGARCIMMCALQRHVFPVDTHCWRISKRLGWVPRSLRGKLGDRVMDHLQDSIPSQLRFSLHVNFLSLGREYCLPKAPRCSVCPITKVCAKIGVS